MKKLKNDYIWGMPAAIHIVFPFPCKSAMINEFKTAILLAILMSETISCEESDRLRVMKQGSEEEIWD